MADQSARASASAAAASNAKHVNPSNYTAFNKQTKDLDGFDVKQSHNVKLNIKKKEQKLGQSRCCTILRVEWMVLELGLIDVLCCLFAQAPCITSLTSSSVAQPSAAICSLSRLTRLRPASTF
jgi:hypothetical protein